MEEFRTGSPTGYIIPFLLRKHPLFIIPQTTSMVFKLGCIEGEVLYSGKPATGSIVECAGTSGVVHSTGGYSIAIPSGRWRANLYLGEDEYIRGEVFDYCFVNMPDRGKRSYFHTMHLNWGYDQYLFKFLGREMY